MPATPQSLQTFVSFCQKHINGHERKEAQTFLDRFFRAFGHEGAMKLGHPTKKQLNKAVRRAKPDLRI